MNVRRHTRAPRGFSLIELVVIMTIIGVLAVFASGRVADRETFDARGYHDALLSAVRYAQRYAIASGCTVRISISAGAYALTLQDAACGAGAAVQSPAGGNFSGTAPAGVGVTSGTGNYDFDARGNVNAGADATLTVSGGGASLSFVIRAGSGYADT